MQEFDPQILNEKPIPPPDDFSRRARVKSLDDYRELYRKASENPEEFWGEQAKLLSWFEPPKQVLDWKPPHAHWFLGGKLNVSYNCLDRHLEKDANKPALMPEIQKIIATASSADWLERLEAAGVPCAPIQDLDAVMADPQTAAIGIIEEVPGIDLGLIGLPLSFDRERPPMRRRAPILGEHNDELLTAPAAPPRPAER